MQTRDVDDILNNYWSTQLDVPPPPLMEQQQQQLEALSSAADAEMATQRSPVAPQGAVASTGAPPEAQNPAQEAPAAPRPSVAAAPVQQPREMELEGAGGGLIGGRGVMAAAAGLGAGESCSPSSADHVSMRVTQSRERHLLLLLLPCDLSSP